MPHKTPNPFETANDVAKSIGISESDLVWLTYHSSKSNIDHYYRFDIPKGNGGRRTISSPEDELRIAQNWLFRAILSRVKVHKAAMAFRRKKSILDNANQHQNKAIVIRVDLKDFFPSIKFPRIKDLFQVLGYNECVADVFALLVTEIPFIIDETDGFRKYVPVKERQLPQGACTSPALVNILCFKMDEQLTKLADSYGFTYTRYADDCVFSHTDPDIKLGLFLTSIKNVIKSEGFIINEEKTRVMRSHNRQVVTGLVVNQKPSVSRENLRNFRAFLHHCEVEGLDTMSKKLDRNALAYAQGYLAFIQMVSPAKAEQLRQKHSWLK